MMMAQLLIKNVGRRSCSRLYCTYVAGDDCEWWAVEGRIINVNAIRNIKKKGEEDERIEVNPRKLFQDRMNHLSRVRLAPGRDSGIYWHAYLKTYQEARDEWEKLVWNSPRKHKPITDDNFFDAPLIKKSKKKNKENIDKKPFSMEEIQAAIRENVKRTTTDKNIEYRSASDSKWPF